MKHVREKILFFECISLALLAIIMITSYKVNSNVKSRKNAEIYNYDPQTDMKVDKRWHEEIEMTDSIVRDEILPGGLNAASFKGNSTIIVLPSDMMNTNLNTNNSNQLIKVNMFISIIISCLMIVGFLFMMYTYEKELKEYVKKVDIDGLTLLLNQKSCEDKVKEYINKKDKKLYGAFTIFDIDNFKDINNKFGHAVGNDVLVEVAEIMKQNFTKDEMLFRWGGDEFIIFVKDIPEDEISEVENRIKVFANEVSSELKYYGKDDKLSLSIGVAVFKKDIEFKELLEIADSNLYEIKRNGKNGLKIKVI